MLPKIVEGSDHRSEQNIAVKVNTFFLLQVKGIAKPGMKLESKILRILTSDDTGNPLKEDTTHA